ncbi:MAG: glycosyltransferase family 39 protein [Acidobacteria bacterium]|nr:glycosyltransferase family 39 protein [Acidobacteriota bacterium]
MDQAPVWYRRGFFAICAVAAFVIAAHIALAFWARNEIAAAESIIALHSMMLAQSGGLYYSNQAYPYTVTPYMPVFYLLEAALFRTGIPIFLAGRLLSIAALFGILYLTWKIVLLYTRDRWCAGTAVVLCACTTVVPGWGTIGRVDMLAVCFSIAAFYFYARYTVAEPAAAKNLAWSAVFAFASLMTKQTLVAAPAAICLLLFFRKDTRVRAIQYAVAVAGGAALVTFGTDWLLHGRFLFNTVFANVNPFAAEKLQQHAEFYFISLGQLLVVIFAGLSKAIRGHFRDPLVYLGISFAVLAATAGKIGSDTNYHIESAVLIAICTAISLHLLAFHSHVFRGSKAWITLLQLPLLIHVVNNVRIMIPFFQSRVVQEFEMDDYARRLKPYYASGDRPVIAMDFNSLIRSRGKLDVEPLIYTILVNAGRIDPEPMRKDIEAGAIPVIMLHQDLAKPNLTDPEIPSLPAPLLAAMRNRYEYAGFVPGPYFGGVYVYRPANAHTAVKR